MCNIQTYSHDPCYISAPSGFEVICPTSAVLSSAYNYNLGTYIRRGVSGTVNSDHPSGSRFASLNSALFALNTNPAWIGKVLYFKFAAYNHQKGQQNALGNCTVYTYTPSGIAGSLIFSSATGVPVLAASSTLNATASMLPSQGIVLPYTTSATGVVFTWSAQSILRPDGTTLAVPAGSASFSSLSPSTEYYTYWYINVSTGVLSYTNSSTPPTSPNATMAVQTGLDGRIPIGVVSFTTPASGTGSGTGGGGDVCPEASELVAIVRNKEELVVSASEVVAGDYIKGKSFATNTDVYRMVIHARMAPCAAWSLVDGHRVSPCEAVFHEGGWKPAFRATGSKLDTTTSKKVLISVSADEADEQNYYLVSGGPLLIHNMQISPC